MTGRHRDAGRPTPGALRVLVRAHLRRDRWLLLWWPLAGTLLYWSQAVSIDGLYATQAELDTAAASMGSNAAFVAMAGPPRALDTVGGQVAWQSTAFGVVLAGLMSMFLVTRHTRAEEESGRDELVRAAVVGRREPLVAALVVALVANLLLGGLVTLSLVGYGLAGPDSLALGVGLALAGLLFAALTLVAAQLVASTRAVHGLVGAVLGAAYALRAVGDVTGTALVWASPIGWYQAMHAFSGLRWWPAGLLVLATAAAVPAALALFDRRDVGSGLWAGRPGPARAGPLLAGPVGLAWRLQRGAVLGWATALFLVAVSYGAIGDSAGDLLGDQAPPGFVVGGADLVTGFYAAAAVMLGLICSGFAISSALRVRGEETDGRVEVLLAAPLSRTRWLLAHVAVTVLGTLLVVAAAGLGLLVGYAGVTGRADDAVRYALPVLQQTAPVLVLAAVALLLQGAVPRAARAAWLVLVGCVVVLAFGEAWRIPDAVQALSPFHHLAAVPAEPMAWTPLLVTLLVAVVAGVAAQVAFSRRDIG